MVSRTGYTGEDGLEIMIAKSQAVPLWEDLVRRGAKPCGIQRNACDLKRQCRSMAMNWAKRSIRYKPD